ncbi:ribonuclease P protein component [Acidimangrovimonas pyrenivorans]|uniref:Ribonuclease P protein component n=1 Tax=Acidimangrovimonas pyrenivorans TaxID=2030798 RepID=A0ABV7AIE4_9RHOB
MTPPMQTSGAGARAETEGEASAVSSCPPLTVLAKRADFLRAANARRQGAPGFLLQARRRGEGEAEGIRVGYTCSKKIGNAVTRNRAKRRLREVARAVLPEKGRPDWDYVLVGRPEATVSRPFDQLLDDLRTALDRIHSDNHVNKPRKPRPGGKPKEARAS